jgi:UDP-hydrolysing UDP-N-acetyl-D-glucosamine 2-epimerase
MDLGIIATGMHLDPRFGQTVHEIERDGFRIAGRIETDLGSSESFMARAIADTVRGCCDILEAERPDILLLLGDRGEMLAGAIAALHLNIPIAHIHGGERSGTVDEPVRHAISKLAHIHLTATTDATERLVKMGEHSDNVYCLGAPGLDGLQADAVFSKEQLLEKSGIPDGLPIASKMRMTAQGKLPRSYQLCEKMDSRSSVCVPMPILGAMPFAMCWIRKPTLESSSFTPIFPDKNLSAGWRSPTS